MTMMHAGDQVRFQLSPDGSTNRYIWNYNGNCWKDTGYSGPWVIAEVVATTFEPGSFVAWEPDPIAIVRFNNAPTYIREWHFPLPPHPLYPVGKKLPGWPEVIPNQQTAICTCGKDKARAGGIHYDWCDRKD